MGRALAELRTKFRVELRAELCARLGSLNISSVEFFTELLREFHLEVLVQGLQLLLFYYHNMEMSTKQIYYTSGGLSIKLQRGFAIFVVE